MNKKILSVLNPVYQHMRKNAIKLSTFLDSNNSFLGRKIQTMINTVLHRSYLAIFTTIRPAKFNPNWLIKNAFLTISEAQKIAKTLRKYHMLLSLKLRTNTSPNIILISPKAIRYAPCKVIRNPIFARRTWLHTRCNYIAPETRMLCGFSCITSTLGFCITLQLSLIIN